MINIVLIFTALLLAMTSIFFIARMIFLKKISAENLKKNKILTHDLKGALLTYGLVIDDLKDQSKKTNSQNFIQTNALLSTVEILEEIKRDIEQSIHKWCA